METGYKSVSISGNNTSKNGIRPELYPVGQEPFKGRAMAWVLRGLKARETSALTATLSFIYSIVRKFRCSTQSQLWFLAEPLQLLPTASLDCAFCRDENEMVKWWPP